MATRASASGGKRISQNEFTEKAWQSIIAAPDIAQNASQQIVDTEHLFKALLEQPNGLARRILAKAGSNPTQLLEKTDQYIRQQPRVTGDSSQVGQLPPRACLISHAPTSIVRCCCGSWSADLTSNSSHTHALLVDLICLALASLANLLNLYCTTAVVATAVASLIISFCISLS